MADLYVATDGSATGTGSKNDPMTIGASIAATGADAGDTVYMRGGIYSASTAGLYGASSSGMGAYRFQCAGSSGSSITFRPYPGEYVRINGGVEIYTTGGYIDFKNIEFAPTPTTRSFADAAAVNLPAIYVTRPGVRFLDCYLHDYQSVYPMEAVGFEMHGCIVGWMGWYQVDTTYNEGYNIYAHNDGGGAVNIKKNAFLLPMNSDPTEYYNIHLYSPTNDIRDYDLQYNVFLQLYVLFGGDGGTNSGNVFSHNYMYGTKTGYFAYTWNGNTNPSELTAQYNHVRCIGNFYPEISFYYKTLNYQYNTIVQAFNFGYYYPHPVPGTISWNNNYYKGSDNAAAFNLSGTGYNLADWRTNSGFDAASTITVAPVANVTDVIVSDYSHRGFVVIYNYANDAAVTVNISTVGLTDEAKCYYANCLNIGERVYFKYDSDNPYLTIPMAAARWSQRSPTAYDSPVAWYSEPFPNFGVFLVEEDTYVEKPV